MKLAVWISLGAFGLFVSVAGCVTDAESLFSSNSNNGAGGSGEGGSGQGASSTATSSTSSGTSTSSSGSSSSGSSSSSASSSASSSSGTTDITVFCAGSECEPGNVCCYRRYDQGQSQDFCSPDANCGNGYSVLSCNGPSDCPGAICCATRMNNDYTDISCQVTCDGAGQLIMCEGDQSVCPANLNCEQSMSLGTGYQICR